MPGEDHKLREDLFKSKNLPLRHGFRHGEVRHGKDQGIVLASAWQVKVGAFLPPFLRRIPADPAACGQSWK